MRRFFVLLLTAASLGVAPDSQAQLRGLPEATVEIVSGEATALLPFESFRRWMIVEARVAGSAPLRFILDSGAPIVVLADAELGSKLPLEIAGKVLLGGAGDGAPTPVALAAGVTVELAGVTIRDAAMAVGAAGGTLAGMDGILGGSLFRNLVVEIGWADSALRLHDPDRYRYEGNGTILPLHLLDSGHLLVEGVVGTGESQQAVRLLVDTGAGHALSLERGLAAGSAPLSDLIIGWGSNGVARGDIGVVNALSLGDIVMHDIVTSFPAGAPWSSIGAAQGELVHGNIGQRVLERFRVIFDVPGGRLILEPNQSSGAPFVFDTTGLALAPWSPGTSSIEIAEVIPDSPAAHAGILAGDQLLTIDGRTVDRISADDIETLLWGPPGVEIEVAVSRDGRRRLHTLTRRRLLR